MPLRLAQRSSLRKYALALRLDAKLVLLQLLHPLMLGQLDVGGRKMLPLVLEPRLRETHFGFLSEDAVRGVSCPTIKTRRAG